MLQSGLCERLITAAHRRELAAIPDERQPAVLHDKAAAAEVLCLYVADVTRVALERMQESKTGRASADCTGQPYTALW